MNNCPYCSKTLEKQLKRKEKCPFCNNLIIVRNGIMMTEYSSNKIDWLKRVSCLDVTDEDLDFSHNKLIEKFKQEPSFNDVCWNVLNGLLVKYVNHQDKLKKVYLEMARILEIEGRDNSEMITRASRIDLLEYKKAGYKYVQIYNCNDAHVCEDCRKMENEIFPIDKAIEIDPIPKRCKNKYCRCWYVPKGSLLDTY